MLDWLQGTGQVPNALSTLRLLACWVPLGILLTTPAGSWGWRMTAMGVFVLIVATDFLDGFLARRWSQVTVYGKVVDPLADKMLVALTMVGLCATSLASPWGWILMAIIIGREVLVTVARAVKKHRGNLVIPANWDGKLKMALQSTGIVLAFLPHPLAQVAAWACLLASLPYAWRSAMAYLRA